jgi:hypothetical protein
MLGRAVPLLTCTCVAARELLFAPSSLLLGSGRPAPASCETALDAAERSLKFAAECYIIYDEAVKAARDLQEAERGREELFAQQQGKSEFLLQLPAMKRMREEKQQDVDDAWEAVTPKLEAVDQCTGRKPEHADRAAAHANVIASNRSKDGAEEGTLTADVRNLAQGSDSLDDVVAMLQAHRHATAEFKFALEGHLNECKTAATWLQQFDSGRSDESLAQCVLHYNRTATMVETLIDWNPFSGVMLSGADRRASKAITALLQQRAARVELRAAMLASLDVVRADCESGPRDGFDAFVVSEYPQHRVPGPVKARIDTNAAEQALRDYLRQRARAGPRYMSKREFFMALKEAPDAFFLKTGLV